MDPACIAFIGGGNMASALIGGLRRAGHAAAAIVVVEPAEAQRARLAQEFGVQSQAAADARMAAAATVVWDGRPDTLPAWTPHASPSSAAATWPRR